MTKRKQPARRVPGKEKPVPSVPQTSAQSGPSYVARSFCEETAASLYNRISTMFDDPLAEVERQIERAEFYSKNVSHSCDLEVWQWVKSQLVANGKA